MTEPITRFEINHMKEDITKIEVKVTQQEVDNKAQFKEQAIMIASIRDSNYEMKFLVNHVIQSQSDMVEQNKETAKDNKDTNKSILDAVSDIQNAPFLAFKKMNWFVKSTIIGIIISFLATYFYGAFMSFIRMNAGR